MLYNKNSPSTLSVASFATDTNPSPLRATRTPELMVEVPPLARIPGRESVTVVPAAVFPELRETAPSSNSPFQRKAGELTAVFEAIRTVLLICA